MATWLDDIQEALENLGGIASLSDIYAEVARVRQPPHPKTLDAIVRGTIETYSSDSAKFNGTDIFFSADGIGNGVWGLRLYISDTPKASDLPETIELLEEKAEYLPDRAKLETYRILRDTALAREVKVLYKNRCQVCGETVTLHDGMEYSEAHHIRPLGKPHNGPDIAGNVLVLCPNHHVMLDYGAMKIEIVKLITHPRHEIGASYVDYHNTKIFRR